ncbi:MAG TPA: carboxypeptidase-like regulatory domain-containing protein, partial [Gemmatimonadales bacterium]
MTLRVWGIFFSFCFLSVPLAEAQVRQITGKVTNASTQQGLPEATIAVSGTGIVAETNNEGNYVLNAPAGDVNLVVRAIGYKRQQVAVPALQSTADVALDP